MIFLSLFFVICVVANGHSDTRFHDYWTVDEYQEIFPDEKNKSEVFSSRVRANVSSGDPASKPIKIGVIYPGLQISDYWRRSVSSMKARLDNLVPNYQLVSHFTLPDTAISDQAEQLGKFIQLDVDYLIFTLNAERHKNLISKVLGQGKTKLILQNITTPLKHFRTNQPLQYVGFDHVTGTEILAREYLRRMKNKANYAILYGSRGYVSNMRGGTFRLKMKNFPMMKLLSSYYVGLNRKKAYLATLDILKNQPEIDFIFSSATDITLGIIDGLKERNKLGKVMTNGWGGGESELASIEKGYLDFTVMRMSDDSGVAMAETIYLDQLGRSSEIPQVFSGDIVLLEKEMPIEEIKELKNRAFRYSK